MYEPITEDDQVLPLSRSVVLPEPVTETFYPINETSHVQPPPYTATPTTPTYSGSNITISSSEVPAINCRVCHTLLNIECRLHLHVIKCHACSEATPIRPAPFMKKYVRCPCNCLLICKVTSERVVCPRDNCKRVISLLPLPLSLDGLDAFSQDQVTEEHSFTRRVVCAYCNSLFPFKQSRNACSSQLQICPHCDHRSYVGDSSKRWKMCIFSIFLVFALLASGAVSCAAFLIFHKQHDFVFFCIFLGFIYVATLIVVITNVYYCRIKVSKVERISGLQYT